MSAIDKFSTEAFKEWILAQDKDREIREHFTWNGCAVGDYYHEVLGESLHIESHNVQEFIEFNMNDTDNEEFWELIGKWVVSNPFNTYGDIAHYITTGELK